MSAEDLSQRIETKKEQIKQVQDDRIQRGLGRARRAEKVRTALEEIHIARGTELERDRSNFYTQKSVLDQQEYDLKELNDPISADEKSQRMHAIKSGIGAKSRELAKARRALKPDVKALKEGMDSDIKPAAKIWEESSAINRAESQMMQKPDRYNKIASIRDKRMFETVDRKQREAVLNSEEVKMTEMEADFELDKLSVETGCAELIKILANDPSVLSFKSANDSAMKVLIDRNDWLKRNIDLCENPKVEGFLFLKAPILYSDKGEKYKVTEEKLQKYKNNFLNELSNNEHLLNQKFTGLRNGVEEHSSLLFQALRNEILKKINIRLNSRPLDYSNDNRSEAVSVELDNLNIKRNAIVVRLDDLNTKYRGLLTEINTAVKTGVQQIVAGWYPRKNNSLGEGNQ